MNWVARTLWDLMTPAKAKRGVRERAVPPQTKPKPKLKPDPDVGTLSPKANANGASGAKPRAKNPKQPMKQRYDALVAEMKLTHGIRIRKWRNSSSGCAWQVKYHDGTQAKLIESPYPRGPMSCAIFLHEVGHHAIGFGTYRPRCLEEYYAWKWSIDEMRRRGLNVTPAVERRMAESLHYAVAKARRRGLKRLPAELVPYLQRPSGNGTSP